MNLAAAWRKHVNGPSGGELKQALVRVWTSLLVTLFVYWDVSRNAGFIDQHRIGLTALAAC